MPTWKSYEEVARFVIEQLKKEIGVIDVEGKQKIAGHITGTKWEIDAKAIKDGHGAFLIVEARERKTSKISQEAMAAVAYRIIDSGASGGITVSPFDVQSGAKMVAAANNIKHMILDPNSTEESWVAQIGNILSFGITEKLNLTDSYEVVLRDSSGKVVDCRGG